MSTERGKAVRWVAVLGVGAVVVAAAGWWALDAWAERRLSAASAWLGEETRQASIDGGGVAGFEALRSSVPDLRWTEREIALLERLRDADGPAWGAAELAAAREILGPRRSEVERLGELIRSAGEGPAPVPGSSEDPGIGARAAGPNRFEDDVGLLRAARLLAIDSRVALAEGDVERSVERVEDLTALIRAFEGASGLVRQMFAASVEGHQLHAVADLVASPVVGRRHVVRLRAAVSDREISATLRRMMQAQAEEYLANLDELRSEDPAGDALRRVEVAEVVAAYGELATTPFSEVRRRVDERLAAARSPERPADVLVGLAIPNMLEAFAKIQAAGAGRQLARLALELRLRSLDLGAYPASLAGLPGAAEPDPFAGEPPRWETGPEGAVLTNPAAEALWETADRRGGPPFTWRLPA